jgi:hypothetical protein
VTQLNHIETAEERHYETPTYDPRCAFARTLRGGEMARLALLSPEPRRSGSETHTARVTPRASGEERHFESRTFDPRSAFARTLRAGEVALRERRQRTEARPHVLANAA